MLAQAGVQKTGAAELRARFIGTCWSLTASFRFPINKPYAASARFLRLFLVHESLCFLFSLYHYLRSLALGGAKSFGCVLSAAD